MYESTTYEVILQRMIDRVLATNPNLDTREGSIIHTALAPAAAELQNAYVQLDAVLNESFADTASRTYLIKRAAERGIIVQAASKAIRQGEFNMDVPIGSRFSLNGMNYAATEKINVGIFKLECETAGTAGNAESGTLLPIDYIGGLTSAELTDVLILGEDDEETEALRLRYYDSLGSLAFGGNIADYKEKVHAQVGVGGVKVYPAWDGGGTVKLVIQDSAFGVPSGALITAVQTAIDPTVNSGEGLGLAPIGHVVTVVGVASTVVNIAFTVTYEGGWDWAAIEAYALAAIDAYFVELAATWEGQSALVVRISQIESRLLDLTGILDISGTTLNAVGANLILAADNIPTRGTVVGS